MTNTQFIFSALKSQEMANIVAFMKKNKTMSLAEAINYFFEVITAYDEDFICERNHDIPSAEQLKSYRIDTKSYNVGNPEDDEIPF